MARARFEIRHTWNGARARRDEFARVDLVIDRVIEVVVEAPFHDDPAPASDPGPTDRLWEYEVVELFLLGADERYLEIELGPHGHHLGLQLVGRRRVVEQGFPIEFRVERSAARWHGLARLDLAHRPPGLGSANAYAIHGTGAARRYLAAHPVPGPQPDFHRLECFPPLDPAPAWPD